MSKKILLLLVLFFLVAFKKDTNKINYSSIIEKYKGKVIYVDMWASWCVPCRKEIKKMKVIKEKFKSNDIAFVFITMDLDREICKKAIVKDGVIEEDNNYFIIDIIKDDKYKEIKKSGSIPHYLIYNKKGELVNTDAPDPSEKEKLYKELDKYISE